MEANGQRIAYDICPVNIVLNPLAARLGMAYDDKGAIARSGIPIPVLLEKLNNLGYYYQKYPKSLGREWLESVFLPRVASAKEPPKNLLRTICDHIALQVNRSITQDIPAKVLVTGGGAHNDFLMERLRAKCTHEWIVPDIELVDYKEALVFAFLGVLRWRNEINVLCSTTGSRLNHVGGAVYQPV
jgi:anhydro-N-acetylmuramic acid kinase